MQSQNISWLHLIITLFKFLTLFKTLNGTNNPNSESYHKCGGTFSCGGNITGVGYPFRGSGNPAYCGHPSLVLSCDGRSNATSINIMNIRYRVIEIDQISQTMRIAREDTVGSVCPTVMANTTLDYDVFEYVGLSMNYTFYYGCVSPPQLLIMATAIFCPGGGDTYVLPGEFEANGCNSTVVVPGAFMAVDGPLNLTEVGEALGYGFKIRWKVESKSCGDCVGTKGRCGYDSAANRTVCYCRYPPYKSYACSPESSKGQKRTKEIITIVSVSVGCALALAITICCLLKRRHSQNDATRKCNRYVENLLLQHGSLAPKRYKYSEIKNMTKSLSDKLGEGGFGSVYKGTLPDGQPVAVKILSEVDSDGEEFINEVASISKTSHINIVTLFGFCYEGKRRALVYEYMANKSLDKFLGSNGDCALDTKKLYEIAVGTAKGLEYLHIGCTTRIVHFDIKPQNILLDQDFCPKISDFGLAKLCRKKQSVLSNLGMRGTYGYIAPEVFSSHYGGASHKSDVYSYGMMLIKMAGGDKIVGTEVERSGENYFPDNIYKQVVTDVTNGLGKTEIREEDRTRRKMMLVGFWCIQTIPAERPSISKVVEMLERSVDSIQIPPKPFLFSTVVPDHQPSSSPFSFNVETD